MNAIILEDEIDAIILSLGWLTIFLPHIVDWNGPLLMKIIWITLTYWFLIVSKSFIATWALTHVIDKAYRLQQIRP